MVTVEQEKWRSEEGLNDGTILVEIKRPTRIIGENYMADTVVMSSQVTAT